MPRPRKYSDAQLAVVEQARKTGTTWAQLAEHYGAGVKAAYYGRKKRKEKTAHPINVWYPASWYAERGLPSPYK